MVPGDIGEPIYYIDLYGGLGLLVNGIILIIPKKTSIELSLFGDDNNMKLKGEYLDLENQVEKQK